MLVSNGVSPMEQIDQWLAEMRKADFAGAVAVSKEELTAVAAEARKAFGFQPSNLAKGCFLLLAFNCAYYDFDGEFWAHFLNRLNLPDHLENQERGRHLLASCWETVLGREMPQADPQWRYVGAVLAETGVVETWIEQFASVIGSSPGQWSELLEQHFDGFGRALPPNLGARLDSFLRTPAGWEFAWHVARLLLRWHECAITPEQLDSARDFRPGFFQELRRHFDTPLGAQHPRVRFVGPRIMFDHALGLPVVRFDPRMIEAGECKLAGEAFNTPSRPLRRLAEFRERLSWASGQSAGHLTFWAPSEEKPCVLFHPQTGVVPHRQRPAPGAHFLLARENFALPETLAILSDYSFAGLEDATMKWWTVEIEPDAAVGLPGYEVSPEHAEEPALQWSEDARMLDGAADVRAVFVEALPRICVRNMDSLPTDWQACVEIGGEVRASSARGGILDVPDLLPSPPFAGAIWIEFIGRRRGNVLNPAQRLEFVVVSRTQIDWPRGLYAPSDKPELSVERAESVSVEWENAEAAGTGRWQVKPDVSCLEGLLKFGLHSVRVARRIRRARCFVPGEGGRTTFDLDEWRNASRLCFDGLPGTPIRIGLTTASSETIDIYHGSQFGNSGTWEGAGAVFVDALRGYSASLAVVCLHDGRRWVSTDVRVFNVAAIETLLGQGESPQSEWLNQDEAEALETFVEALRDTRAPGEIAGHLFLRGVQELLTEFGWMSATFAALRKRTKVAPSDAQSAREPWRRIAAWIREVLPFLRGDRVSEIEAACLAERGRSLEQDSLPAALRWGELLRRAIAQMEWLAATDEMLREWCVDVRERRRPPQSKLAQLPSGNALTDAWQKRWVMDPAAIACAQAVAESEHPIIRSLARLLVAIIRGRAGRPFDAAKPPNCPRLLAPLFAALRSGAAVNRAEVPVPLPNEDVDWLSQPR